MIGTNHGHTLMIPIADVIAGATKTYTAGLTVGNGHTHDITVTAADFTAMKTAGMKVVTSAGPTPMTNSHMHACTLSC
jgi:hypothetical protein